VSACVILGGGGYIGHHWACRLAARRQFDSIVVGDLRPPSRPLPDRASCRLCDVRQPLAQQLAGIKPDWLFNFAAVHREPGHERHEYFDTNLPGARNVCDYAEAVGCQHILFTSSIAVYGPTSGPSPESAPTHPISPYGISKLAAELILDGWRRADKARGLIICRPGVVYGPGDPGNILRMVRAIKKGYFVFPGNKNLRKSYAYIEGLLDSFEFMMARSETPLTYNYVERETESLGTLVRIVQEHLGKRIPTVVAPLLLLQMAAGVMQGLTAGRSPIHPARVRKAATSTHIVPQVLQDLGFAFRYDFRASLRDWSAKAPEDFS
jgi:nucleoside-diphosphate-sugar epimerase